MSSVQARVTSGESTISAHEPKCENKYKKCLLLIAAINELENHDGGKGKGMGAKGQKGKRAKRAIMQKGKRARANSEGKPS